MLIRVHTVCYKLEMSTKNVNNKNEPETIENGPVQITDVEESMWPEWVKMRRLYYCSTDSIV